jgi:GTPase
MEELEKTFLIGAFFTPKKEYEIKQILEELKLLTQSAGGDVLDTYYQRRKAPDKRYLIGKGKAAEIKNIAYAKNVTLLIFYNPLSNLQQRNLERFFKRKVVDRTRLILDIFATRAQTLEGKLQVELAQLLYQLPRLSGQGAELSRLGGGIGTRGPGETKLETDRRTIKKRIRLVKKRLEKVIKNRDIQRKSRQSHPIPVVSLVGYTSAGKSTLFKALTHQDVKISRMLFSTLDPLMRRVDLTEIKEGYSFLLSDTVGFIREMPKELFQAFKATLEEMIQANIILHVIDISDPDYLDRKSQVTKVLEQLSVPEDRVLYVYNKIDLLDDSGIGVPVDEQDGDGEPNREMEHQSGNKVYVSALKGQGLMGLKKMIFDDYFLDYEAHKLVVPPGILNPESVKKWAIVLSKQFHEKKIVMDILCSRQNMVKFKEKYGGFVK